MEPTTPTQPPVQPQPQTPVQPSAPVTEQKLDRKYIPYYAVSRSVSTIIVFLILGISGVGAAIGSGTAIAAIVILGLAFVALLVGFGISYLWGGLVWKHYSYHIDEQGFTKKYGVINLRNTVIPYDRIQNIDIRRPFLLRIFGLAEINIQTAGGSTYGMVAEGVLPGITPEVAEQLQRELLEKAKAHRGL